jgi:hypothetical protein
MVENDYDDGNAALHFVSVVHTKGLKTCNGSALEAM